MDARDGDSRDREENVGEELEDRRPVEFAAFFSGLGDQGRSVGKQRRLQLRGIGVNRGDDGR